MSTEQIIVLLIAERDRLNRAIEVLGVGVKKRGRPPKNQVDSAVGIEPVKTRKKRTFSAAQRNTAAQRMKAYWAARKKEK
jgi:hypothetical protein